MAVNEVQFHSKKSKDCNKINGLNLVQFVQPNPCFNVTLAQIGPFLLASKGGDVQPFPSLKSDVFPSLKKTKSRGCIFENEA